MLCWKWNWVQWNIQNIKDEVFSDEVKKQSRFDECYERFQKRRKEVADKSMSGRPKTSITVETKAIIFNNQGIAIA